MRAIHRCLSVLLVLTGIILFVFCMLPQVFHLTPKVVVSGSMEPAVSVGSIAYLESRTKAEDIQEGDVIVYALSDGTQIMHRVLLVRQEERFFVTKGDANETADAGAVDFTQYQSRQVAAVPRLGYVVWALNTGKGKIFSVLFLGGFFLLDSQMRRKEEKSERKAKPNHGGMSGCGAASDTIAGQDICHLRAGADEGTDG